MWLMKWEYVADDAEHATNALVAPQKRGHVIIYMGVSLHVHT